MGHGWLGFFARDLTLYAPSQYYYYFLRVSVTKCESNNPPRSKQIELHTLLQAIDNALQRYPDPHSYWRRTNPVTPGHALDAMKRKLASRSQASMGDLETPQTQGNPLNYRPKPDTIKTPDGQSSLPPLQRPLIAHPPGVSSANLPLSHTLTSLSQQATLNKASEAPVQESQGAEDSTGRLQHEQPVQPGSFQTSPVGRPSSSKSYGSYVISGSQSLYQSPPPGPGSESLGPGNEKCSSIDSKGIVPGTLTNQVGSAESSAHDFGHLRSDKRLKRSYSDYDSSCPHKESWLGYAKDHTVPPKAVFLQLTYTVQFNVAPQSRQLSRS